MLSSLLNLCSSLRQPEVSERRLTGSAHATFSILFQVRQQFMLGLGHYGWLFNLPIWGWLHHLFWLPNLPLFLWGGRQWWSFGGICRYWIVRAELSTLIRLIQYAAVWNRCCLIHIYTIARALTAGSRNPFPTVTLVAALLFANDVSQHALIILRSWTPPSVGNSSEGWRESLIRPNVHLLEGRGGGWVEEMRWTQ